MKRMKKTCNGCRALENGIIHSHCWECSLGYNIDCVKGIPKEYCPKPMTIPELIEISKLRTHNSN